ncbi:ferric reductase-like transmembrane domain-containing protein [Stappia sp. ES.058]|uniref:ferredoxin reductase family protein n=1 Tax=Stappia sp. ES.058 TaxID=1881061 RepID=UPI00087A3A52|nr:ferredoxin reductase family protein [Stappia sp. ES.058]SDU02882.1 Predicted ferric reductase [Stappia sp. ES.058]
MPAIALIGLYLLVVFAPLGLAVAGGWPPRPVLDELAAGAGLVAFAILLAEFLLSGRFRAVSGRVGMDVTMRFHQLLARTALALAVVHPFLYTLPFNRPLPYDPTRQLTLTFEGEGLVTGVLAFLLLPSLVILSIGRDKLPFRYETWRFLHGMGALAVAGLVYLHAVEAGRYSQDWMLRWFWSGLLGLAVVSLLVVYVVKPLLQLRRKWHVSAVRQVAERTWELAIAPDGHEGLDYRAGQFVWLNVGHSPFSLNENPFSICSAPGDGREVRFLIKELGDFTSSLSRVRTGTQVHLDGPHGHLTLEGRAAPGIAFIAGGVGIAPMFSLLGQLVLEADTRPTVLVYGNRAADQIALGDKLARLRRVHKTQVVQVLSDPPADWSGEVGIIDAARIRALFGEEQYRDWLFVLCGPPAMMEIVEDTLIGIGVAPRNILAERFHYD